MSPVTRFTRLGVLLFLAGCGPAAVSDGDSSTQAALTKTGQLPGVLSADAVRAADAKDDTPARLSAQAELNPLADDAEEKLALDPNFSSVTVDPDRHTLVVYRVGGEDGTVSRTLQPRMSARATLVVRPALLTRVQAEATAERLQADHQFSSTSFQLRTWGPDAEGGPFRVGVTGDTKEALAQLEKRFPELQGRIAVERSAPEMTASRLADTAPYWGGDRLNFADHSACSSGFAVKNRYGRFFLTAAHCDCLANTHVWNGGKLIGSFSGTPDVAYDSALISLNAEPNIWANTYGGTAAGFTVNSMNHPHVGEYICTSGSFSGLRCNGRVGGWTYVLPSGNCHGDVSLPLWWADQVNHLSLLGHGDSGGPVFVRESSSNLITARGTISAGDIGGRPADCAEGGRTRGCSWRVFFPDIANVSHRHFDFVTYGF